VGLVKIFYTLRFETSLFVVSYDSQSYGLDIRHHIYTGLFPNSLSFLHCCSYLCLHLLKTFLSQPSREDLFEGFGLSVLTKNTPPLCTKGLLMLALSCERVYNCHPDNDSYCALIVAVA
jgi:hypothetical protein